MGDGYHISAIYNIHLLKFTLPNPTVPCGMTDILPFPSHQSWMGVRFRCLPSSCNTWLNTCYLIKPEKRFGKCRKRRPIRRCAWNSVSFLWQKTCEKRFNGWKWSWGDFFFELLLFGFFLIFFLFFYFILFLFFSSGGGGSKKRRNVRCCKVTPEKNMWPGNCECHTVVISSNPPGCKPWGLSDFPGHISSSKWILQRFRVPLESLPTWAWQSHPTVVLLWVRAAGFVSAKGQKIQLRPTDPVWHRCRKKMQMKFLEDGVWGHLKCLWLYTKHGGKEVRNKSL